MLKKYVYIGIMLSISGVMYPQIREFKKISFKELRDSVLIYPKPILIKITTDWCAICKIQDKQILKSAELFKKISERYYFVELNAETKETIIFNNNKYKYIPNGVSNGVNELAFILGNIKGQLSYPTWVILDQNYEILFQYPGLIKSETLEKLL